MLKLTKRPPRHQYHQYLIRKKVHVKHQVLKNSVKLCSSRVESLVTGSVICWFYMFLMLAFCMFCVTYEAKFTKTYVKEHVPNEKCQSQNFCWTHKWLPAF